MPENLFGRIFAAASLMTIGTAFARGSTVIAFMVLTRVIGKEAVGQFSYIFVTVTALTLFAATGIGNTAARYVSEYRINSRERAGQAASSLMVAAAIWGVACAVIVEILATWLSVEVVGNASLEPLLRIAALGAIFVPVSAVVVGVLSGFGRFGAGASVMVFGGAVLFISTVAGGHIAGVRGAIVGLLIGQLVELLTCVLVLRWVFLSYGLRPKIGLVRADGIELIRAAAPTTLAAALMGPVQWLILSMLAGSPHGVSAVAEVHIATQWFMFAAFVPIVASRASIPILTSSVAQGGGSMSRPTLWRFMATNALIAFPIAGLAIVFAPYILNLYGAEFRGAVHVFQLFMIASVFAAASVPTTSFLIALGRQGLDLVIGLCWAIVAIVVTWMFLAHGSSAVAFAWIAAYAVKLLVASLWLAPVLTSKR